jgi:hypothetical protein
VEIADILGGTGGSGAIGTVATAFGIDPALAGKAVGAVLPELAGRIERNTLSRGGIADLLERLGDPGYAEALDDPSRLATPEGRALGIEALDEILWSKDRSRAVAARAARETGLSETEIKELLPAIAAMAMGALSKASSGALGEIVARLGGSPLPLPGEAAAPRGLEQEAAPQSRASKRPAPASRGEGGVPNPLPGPGDGMVRPGRRPPMAEPGDGGGDGGGDNPYGDLSDIIRRGGWQIPGGQSGTGGVSGAGLGQIVRSILGQLLGFQNRGFLGWLVNLILIKIALPVLKRVLSRVLFGR